MKIEPKEGCDLERHEIEGACYKCCDRCNYQSHHCHFCGTDLSHDSFEYVYDKETKVTSKVRHWLSDCRPDLVYHEPGPICTWSFRTEEFMQKLLDDGKTDLYEHYKDLPMCYAYECPDRYEGDKYIPSEWTESHNYFLKDGPMV